MNITCSPQDEIKEMLEGLSEEAIREVRDFIAFLREKERKRRALEKRVLKAEKETPIRFESVEEAVKAVFDETND